MGHMVCTPFCAKYTKRFLILVTSMLVSTASFAQETSADREEKRQQVPENGATLLGTILLYADRLGDALWDVPASVNVVDGAQAEARGQTDMQEIIRYVPGVTVPRQTTATDPFNTFGGFVIRGVGSNRVQIQQDGSRVAERIMDSTRDYLDFNFTKQVDVVKGPASVLWGADALGGVVAVETIDPEDILNGRTRGGTASLSYDSLDNEREATLAYAQKFGTDLDVMLGISRKAANEAELSNARDDGGIWGCPRNIAYGATPCGTIDPTDVDALRFLGKAVWTPSDAHRLEFTFDHLDRDVFVHYNKGLGPDARTGETIHDYDQELDLKRTRYAIEHQWTLGGGFIDELKTTLAYAPHSYDRFGSAWATLSNGDSVNSLDYMSYSEKFLELDVQATSRFVIGNADHELTFGFDGDYATTDYQRVNVIRNITRGTVNELRGQGFNFANAETRRAGLYIQDKITLMNGALELTPGLRYAIYTIIPKPDADYKVFVGSEPRTRKDDALLLNLGALYKFNQEWSGWARYGEGFKMPTAQQLYTSFSFGPFELVPAPNLRPEEVKSYELGVRRETNTSAIGVSAFYSGYTDFIKSFYFVPNTNKITYINLPEVRVWGVELEGEWALNDRMRINGSATWQKGTQRAEVGAEKQPYGLPPLRGTLGLSYDIPQYDLTLDFVSVFADGVENDSRSNNFEPGGYAVFDVFANWQISDTASLNIGVKNLFDRRYFEPSAAGYELNPRQDVKRDNPLELQTAPGRVFTVSLDMKF